MKRSPNKIKDEMIDEIDNSIKMQLRAKKFATEKLIKLRARKKILLKGL